MAVKVVCTCDECKQDITRPNGPIIVTIVFSANVLDTIKRDFCGLECLRKHSDKLVEVTSKR